MQKIWNTKLLELVSYYSEVAGEKVNMQMTISFLYNNNEQVESEIKNIFYISILPMKCLKNIYKIYMKIWWTKLWTFD